MLKYIDLQGIDRCIYIAGQTKKEILDYLWKNRHLGWMQKARQSIETMYNNTFNIGLDLEKDFNAIFEPMIEQLNVNFS